VSKPVSLGGPNSVIIYRQKETFRRRAQLHAAAAVNNVRRRRRSAVPRDTSTTMSLTFAVSNATQGVLVCSQSSPSVFTILYVCFILQQSWLECLSSLSYLHNVSAVF